MHFQFKYKTKHYNFIIFLIYDGHLQKTFCSYKIINLITTINGTFVKAYHLTLFVQNNLKGEIRKGAIFHDQIEWHRYIYNENSCI